MPREAQTKDMRLADFPARFAVRPTRAPGIIRVRMTPRNRVVRREFASGPLPDSRPCPEMCPVRALL